MPSPKPEPDFDALGEVVGRMLSAKPPPGGWTKPPRPTAADLRRRFRMIDGAVLEVDENGEPIDAAAH